jgi:hypothetical protein
MPHQRGKPRLIDNASLQLDLARQLAPKFWDFRSSQSASPLPSTSARDVCLTLFEYCCRCRVSAKRWKIAIMADQGNRPHRTTKPKKAHSGGPNPKAFAYSTPGKLHKQASRSHDVRSSSSSGRAMLTCAGQREAPPRPARRPPARRSAPNHRWRRWPSRRGQDYAHKVSHPSLHQTDPLISVGPDYSRDLETATPHLHRMSGRLARQHDRCRKGGGYRVAHD